MKRALLLCSDGVLLKTLRVVLSSLGAEGDAPAGLDELRRSFAPGRYSLLIIEARGDHHAQQVAFLGASEPGLRRLFLREDGPALNLREGDAELRGSFSPAALVSVLRSMLEAPAPLEHPTLDTEQLLDCIQGDLSELDRLIGLFFQGASAQIARLRRSLADGQLEEAAAACHRLRGAAATAGAERLAELCKAKMRCLESGDRAVSADLLEAEVERFRAALEAFSRERSAG